LIKGERTMSDKKNLVVVTKTEIFFDQQLRWSYDERYSNTISLIKEKDGQFIFILDRLFNDHGWDKYPLISEEDKSIIGVKHEKKSDY